MSDNLYFASDYMEGAHPAILRRLLETNLEHTAGYGLDPYSESAREKIRAACRAPEAEVFFLVGGTQTNATVIDALLRPWQGVVSARTGHIATHEAGAIEFGGHKVLTLPQSDGKLSADAVARCVNAWRRPIWSTPRATAWTNTPSARGKRFAPPAARPGPPCSSSSAAPRPTPP